MKTIEKRFGERVRELRIAKGLSQEELAFTAGMHRTYLGGIERGEKSIIEEYRRIGGSVGR